MRTLRTLLLTLLALTLLGGGVYVALQYRPGTGPVGTPSPVASDPGVVTESGKYYEIAANYPTGTPLRTGAGERADAVATGLMRGFIDTTVRQFKADGDFDNLTPRDVEMLGYEQGRKQSLAINYLAANSTSTISYIFTISADTLGAHGNMYYKTFTFSATDGSALRLADLFLPESRYLDTLSRISRTELETALGELASADMLRAGTTPDERNFENFFLDDHSLVILFPPYAVAPYAAGPQTLAIPRTELTALLKPAYR